MPSTFKFVLFCVSQVMCQAFLHTLEQSIHPHGTEEVMLAFQHLFVHIAYYWVKGRAERASTVKSSSQDDNQRIEEHIMDLRQQLLDDELLLNIKAVDSAGNRSTRSSVIQKLDIKPRHQSTIHGGAKTSSESADPIIKVTSPMLSPKHEESSSDAASTSEYSSTHSPDPLSSEPPSRKSSDASRQVSAKYSEHKTSKYDEYTELNVPESQTGLQKKISKTSINSRKRAR